MPVKRYLDGMPFSCWYLGDCNTRVKYHFFNINITIAVLPFIDNAIQNWVYKIEYTKLTIHNWLYKIDFTKLTIHNWLYKIYYKIDYTQLTIQNWLYKTDNTKLTRRTLKSFIFFSTKFCVYLKFIMSY